MGFVLTKNATPSPGVCQAVVGPVSYRSARAYIPTQRRGSGCPAQAWRGVPDNLSAPPDASSGASDFSLTCGPIRIHLAQASGGWQANLQRRALAGSSSASRGTWRYHGSAGAWR